MGDKLKIKRDQDTSFQERDDAAAGFVSRQIAAEVMNYGVTQFQLLRLIETLALELESREVMLEIVGSINKALGNDEGPTESGSTDIITDC